MTKNHRLQTRRAVLAGASAAGALGAVPLLLVRPALATPEKMQAAIKSVIGEAPVKKGKVTLDIPPLVENGNTVAMTVTVESPMTAADHVKVIHVFVVFAGAYKPVTLSPGTMIGDA